MYMHVNNGSKKYANISYAWLESHLEHYLELISSGHFTWYDHSEELCESVWQSRVIIKQY